MKNIRNSKILKIIVYTLVPILVLNIGINVVSLIYYSENEEDFVDYKNYISTNSFASEYLASIQRAINIAEDEIEGTLIVSEEKTKQENENAMILEENSIITSNQMQHLKENIQRNFYSIRHYYILLVSKEGNIITNVEKNVNTDTLEEIKEYISKNKFYWQYDKQNIKTNIDKLQYEEIAYGGFEDLIESGYEIYTALKDEDGGYWYRQSLFYDFVANTYETAFINIVISSILLIAGIFYIILSIGHKQGIQGIYIDSLDKIPYEIICILAGILSVIGFIAIKQLH